MSTYKVLITLATLFCGCDEVPQQALIPTVTPETSPDARQSAEMADESSHQDDAIDVTSAAQVDAAELTGKAIKILDGDTIDLLTVDKKTIRIRLNGIDAPEKGQPFGNTAKEFLSEKIGGHVVRVVSHGKDQYGRTIGEVFTTYAGTLRINEDDSIDRENESNPQSSVNVTMVINGLAWHYVKYAPKRTDLADAEVWARSKRLRLWSDARHVAPWEWRKLSKAERDKQR